MTAPAPLQAPDSAPLSTALARDYAVQIDVNYGTGQPPEWVFIMGLNKVSPTTDITMQDDGDIHSGGRKSQIATAIGENLSWAGSARVNGHRASSPIPARRSCAPTASRSDTRTSRTSDTGASTKSPRPKRASSRSTGPGRPTTRRACTAGPRR